MIAMNRNHEAIGIFLVLLTAYFILFYALMELDIGGFNF